jgi:isovaleryl-CoA dehydrogenase
MTGGSTGPRAGLVTLAAAIEGLVRGAGDAGSAIAVISHAALSMPVIDAYACPGVRGPLLARLTRGEVAAFAVTEPHGGSHVPDMRCTLRRQTDGVYRLNGEKWHITNGPTASVIVTFAREETDGNYTALLIDRGAEGVSIGPVIETAGFPNAPASAISFRDVLVTPEQILGSSGQAPCILKEAFLRERLLSAFPVLGLADHAIAMVLDFITTRRSGGRTLADFQYVQGRLTDAAIAIETLRATAHAALDKFLAGRGASMEASLVKLYAGRVAVASAADAIKVCGSYGMLDEAGFAAALHDGLAATIAGGTEEVQRNVIFGEMIRGHKRTKRRDE